MSLTLRVNVFLHFNSIGHVSKVIIIRILEIFNFKYNFSTSYGKKIWWIWKSNSILTIWFFTDCSKMIFDRNTPVFANCAAQCILFAFARRVSILWGAQDFSLLITRTIPNKTKINHICFRDRVSSAFTL